ncbi:FkbM family methyltransferase [Qipengyuania atrilutea]|uniref:FkbM family methyltransferase n=1 Tax=Qipengyuania atrilutea TaxID=2744473 RepID=A0A850GYR1_9SPHN|nr:FkbM family methyltransferase [Actirhodobacter atriluteus]NVD43507.1 FkbM family methyltransferase [Actirhodobacter atriluteus]
MSRFSSEVRRSYIGSRLLGFFRGYVKGFFAKPIKSYAQKGEDLLVSGYFSEPGFYLDIGCYHPKHISNTYLLHKRGWRGCAVDIDQHKVDLFNKARGSRCNAILKAIVGHGIGRESMEVFKFGGHGGWSDIDTLDRVTAEMYRTVKGFGEYTVARVPILGINELLAELPEVNFLNIDVEGLDGELVDALDLDRFPIDVILFEDNEVWGSTSKRREKFAKHGYETLFVSGGSVCFAKPKLQMDH